MIKIHQIYYLRNQLELLDENFLPFDNTANKNREFAEYHVFETAYRSGLIPPKDITGFVSWKFSQKTRIPGSRFLEFISANPGYDVYFINPFPMQAKFFSNLWLQGEFYHPGILELAQKVFDKAGKAVNLKKQVHDSSTALYCNYWGGTSQFWDLYMAYSGPIVEVLRNGLDRDEKIMLHSIADRGNNFSFVAFIIERIFSSMLLDRADVRYLAYRHSFKDIRKKYGVTGAFCHSLFADNSRMLNFFYTNLKKWRRSDGKNS